MEDQKEQIRKKWYKIIKALLKNQNKLKVFISEANLSN